MWPRLRLIAGLAWLLTTVALASWWLIFGLRQTDRLLHLQSEAAVQLARQHRMLVSEGIILIGLVVVGGLFLLYFMIKERRQFDRVKQFFSIYTHDLKTSLASLRLQAEALQEDLGKSPHAPIVERLLRDSVRLELQLENSLYLANAEARLFTESISLRRSLAAIRDHWPELNIQIEKDAELKADSRAVESILKNLIQNALHHGQATQVVINCRQMSTDQLAITLADNGRGFRGDRHLLGELFRRHTPLSGTGMGLFLVSKLLRLQGGELRVLEGPQPGFALELVLPGKLVP